MLNRDGLGAQDYKKPARHEHLTQRCANERLDVAVLGHFRGAIPSGGGGENQMANYSRRDARKAWVADMAAHAEPSADSTLRCHCGEVAGIALTPENGALRFFCEAHKADADALLAEGDAEGFAVGKQIAGAIGDLQRGGAAIDEKARSQVAPVHNQPQASSAPSACKAMICSLSACTGAMNRAVSPAASSITAVLTVLNE